MKTSPQPSVLYVTRPLCPPWDEASKNFAHDLAKHIHTAHLTIMTSGHVSDVPPDVTQADIYSLCPFGTRQKLESLWYQYRHRADFDIAHYFFTPTKLNSFLIRTFLRSARTRTIQTVATLRDDLLSEEDFHNILFADRLVTYTRFAMHKLQRMGFTNVSHAYPGIDLGHFTPDTKDPALLAHFNLTPQHTIIMYPGEYIRLGATDTILDAMEAYWRSDAPEAAHTVLMLALRVKNAADAQKKLAVQERLARNGFAERVIYTDTVHDMRGLYNLADIVLFPVANMHGKFDVPLALIEAYACGKPTIVSDIPRLAEFTNTDISAIIKSEDPAALTVALTRLIRDASLRTALGNAARAFATAHFDITKTATHYEDLYRTLR